MAKKSAVAEVKKKKGVRGQHVVKKEAAEVKTAPIATVKKKPWPTCTTDKCKKPSVLMRRDKNGEEEHFCVPHWNERPDRGLPPSKSRLAPKKIKRKVKVKK